MPDQLLTFFTDFQFDLVIKVAIAIFLFLFVIMVFVVLTNIRSLNRLVFVGEAKASPIVQGLAVAYFIASLSLFFLSLVIL
ncbi:MAG: hypothetical protein HY428_01335 [Candidatus Levybacteria bacterium]|nr:hypothetical protein [Candidatus Levybacteria bacterium]